MRPFPIIRVLLALLLSSAVSAVLPAGTVQVSWNASEAATGYRVHRGTASGDYSDVTDVGLVLSTAIEGLEDCRTWYFAITAYNDAGESGFSPEAATYPRAVPNAALPAIAEPGTQVSVVVSGVNFRPGDVVTIAHPGVQVDVVGVLSCYEISLDLTVAADATLGPVDLLVTHPSGVAGAGTGLLTIVAPTPLAVASTTPGDGATDVPVGVMPVVQFTEAASGVTAENVRLLDDSGSPVAQTAGSPVVSADGTAATLVPAEDLAYTRTYRIQVLGGPTGPIDLDGNPLPDDFVQALGFTTEADEAAPVIADLAVSDVGGTSAVVSWTTDEPADGRVFYRKQGGQSYTELEDPTLSTNHEIALTGLEPETAYEFHVASTDASGQTASTSPDETFVTDASPYHYLRFEAESGEIADPLGVSTGPDAFAGGWIHAPAGPQQGSPGDPLGTASFDVLVPAADTWHLWVRVLGEDPATDSWYESVDDATPEPLAPTVHGAWVWAAGRSYSLGAGQHVVELGGFDPQAAADRLLLTDDPDFLPTEQPDDDVTAPGPVGSFAAQGNEQGIALGWSNPTDDDLQRVVVRFRTDGEFPSSPVDGFPLVDRPATPGDAEGFVHDGVAVGIVYRYGAFAVDGAGNASVAAHAEGELTSAPLPPDEILVE